MSNKNPRPQPMNESTARALAMIGTEHPGGGYWSAYTAARECGVSLTTIYKWVRRLRDAIRLRDEKAAQEDAALAQPLP